jgi:hypothetical protein
MSVMYDILYFYIVVCSYYVTFFRSGSSYDTMLYFVEGLYGVYGVYVQYI